MMTQSPTNFTPLTVLAAAQKAFEDNGSRLLPSGKGLSRVKDVPNPKSNASRTYGILKSARRDKIITPRLMDMADEIRNELLGLMSVVLVGDRHLTTLERRILDALRMESISLGDTAAIGALVSAPEIYHNRQVNQAWSELEADAAKRRPFNAMERPMNFCAVSSLSATVKLASRVQPEVFLLGMVSDRFPDAMIKTRSHVRHHAIKVGDQVKFTSFSVTRVAGNAAGGVDVWCVGQWEHAE
jgi:hypothetical protein